LRASCTEHGCAGPDLQLIPCHSIPHDVPFCVMPPMLLCHVWCAMLLSCLMCPSRCVTCQPGALRLPSGGRGYSWCVSATRRLLSSWPCKSFTSHTSYWLRACCPCMCHLPLQVRHLSAWSPVPAKRRQGLQLVCLCNKPSVEFLALQELHESHLTLVEGSAFSERDLLHRAGLPGSLGAMVLADRCAKSSSQHGTAEQDRIVDPNPC
jgi:hypothetical protein